MTPKERRNPHIIDQKRREQIALGSGIKLQDVNHLLKQFEMICKMRKRDKKLAPIFLLTYLSFPKSKASIILGMK